VCSSDLCKIATADKKQATAADLKVGDKVTAQIGEGDSCVKIAPPAAPKKKQ
jgi:hypothetical protein